jgi:hypothetical protein
MIPLLGICPDINRSELFLQFISIPVDKAAYDGYLLQFALFLQ